MSRGSSLVIVPEGFYTIVFSAIILAQSNSIAVREERVESAFKAYSDLKERVYSDLNTEFSQDMERRLL